MKLILVVVSAAAVMLSACVTRAPGSPAPVADDRSIPSADRSPVAAGGPSGSPGARSTREPTSVDPLLTVELVDVRTSETFTLAALAAEKPVLVEAMAIWCTTCLAQQREVIKAHELADFHSVGIDVDPNERAEDLAEYAERESFDWRFVIADPQLVRLLTDRYGFGVTNPPSTPTFVVSTDGTVRALEFGRLRSADELVGELAAG